MPDLYAGRGRLSLTRGESLSLSAQPGGRHHRRKLPVRSDQMEDLTMLSLRKV